MKKILSLMFAIGMTVFILGSVLLNIKSVCTDSICAERGHISGMVVSQTLMCPITWIVDYEDSTIQYYYNSNYRSYRCTRCGEEITEPVMTDTIRTVIWRRHSVYRLYGGRDTSWTYDGWMKED